MKENPEKRRDEEERRENDRPRLLALLDGRGDLWFQGDEEPAARRGEKNVGWKNVSVRLSVGQGKKSHDGPRSDQEKSEETIPELVEAFSSELPRAVNHQKKTRETKTKGPAPDTTPRCRFFEGDERAR